MDSFTIENKMVTVFPGRERDNPVIYLNTFGHEGKQVLQNLQASNCPDFTLVAISRSRYGSLGYSSHFRKGHTLHRRSR